MERNVFRVAVFRLFLGVLFLGVVGKVDAEPPIKCFNSEFTIRDDNVDGVGDRILGFRGFISQETRPEIGADAFDDEHFIDFDLRGMTPQASVELNIPLSSTAITEVQISKFVYEDGPFVNLFNTGTPLTSVLVTSRSQENYTVDVTEVFNDAIRNGETYVGFRFHDPTRPSATGPHGAQAFLGHSSRPTAFLNLEPLSDSQFICRSRNFNIRDDNVDGVGDRILGFSGFISQETRPEIGADAFDDEHFIDFDLRGMIPQASVELNIPLSSTAITEVQISKFVYSDGSFVNLFNTGTPLTSVLVTSRSQENYTVDVTELFNDAIRNGETYLGFRFHDPTRPSATGPHGAQAFLGLSRGLPNAFLELQNVPEPSTFVLILSGILLMIGLRCIGKRVS